jgi:ppGpp synthetase/RelA/SpoT-type nucleotidyltranferase
MTSKIKEKTLSYDDYIKFLYYVPKIQPFYAKTGKPPMTADSFLLLYKLLFYCALRITETLNLRKSDFDLEKRTVKIYTPYKNRATETTIPPSILGDVKKYIKNKKEEEYLFTAKTGNPLKRVTPWKYAKDAGKLAGLELFQVTKVREIEGISLLLFRDSYKQMMYEYSASSNLVDLKLRNETENRYGNNTLHDLRTFENRIFRRKFSEDEIAEYVAWYQTNIPYYKKLAGSIRQIIKEILERRKINVHDIQFREKDLESFRRKIEEGVVFEPTRMQDLAGIRVICYVKSDVEKVLKVIEDTFMVLSKKSTEIDEDGIENDDFSGYQSIQYVCKLPKSRISIAEELEQFENKFFEIQVRTILQHA